MKSKNEKEEEETLGLSTSSMRAASAKTFPKREKIEARKVG